MDNFLQLCGVLFLMFYGYRKYYYMILPCLILIIGVSCILLEGCSCHLPFSTSPSSKLYLLYKKLFYLFIGLSFTIILHWSLVLEEEKKSGYYSPQFDLDTCESQAKFGHSCSPSSSSTINLDSNSSNVGTSECMDQPGSSHEGEPEITGTRVEEKALPQDNLTQQKISVPDVMCTMCKQLLFHPVVLHCGHGIRCI